MSTSLSLGLCSSVKSTFFLQLKDKVEAARLSLCCYCVDFSSRQSFTHRRSELSAVSVHFKALKSSVHEQRKKTTAASFAGWISESLPEWRQSEASSVYRSYTKIRPKQVIVQRRENFPPVSRFFAVIKPSEHRGEILKNVVRTEDLSVFKGKAEIARPSQRIRRTAPFTLMPESCFSGTLF